MDKLSFFDHIIKLKDVKRTGWIYKQIPDPESVADHSFGVAILALIVPLPEGIDRNKLVSMALVHDLGESKIGDIVWETGKFSNIKKQEKKHISELNTINELFEPLNRNELKELAIEFLEQKSETAKFLKQLDKLEMVLQALEYEKKVHPPKLDEFWENAKKYITDPILKDYFEKLIAQRNLNQFL